MGLKAKRRDVVENDEIGDEICGNMRNEIEYISCAIIKARNLSWNMVQCENEISGYHGGMGESKTAAVKSIFWVSEAEAHYI